MFDIKIQIIIMVVTLMIGAGNNVAYFRDGKKWYHIMAAGAAYGMAFKSFLGFCFM
jgi:lipoprotein signal peptidase